MNPFARTFFIATFVVSIVVADTCYGQLSAPRIRRRNNFGTSVQSHIQNRPTVSPYLNLLNNSSREGIPSYFTQVRPQLQARAAAQRAEQSIESLQQDVTRVESTVRRNSVGGFQTGHPTRFMNTLHYFPLRR